VSDPGHRHIYYAGNGIGAPGYPTGEGDANNNILFTPETAAATTGISVSIGGVGDHTHTITASATTTGGGLAHENRPPYYALAYIMKA
jgi:microcystin-dependent protein